MQHKKLLQKKLNDFENFYLDEVGEVLVDIEDELPEKIRGKLNGEYNRWTRIKIAQR